MAKAVKESRSELHETLSALLLPICTRMLASGLGVGELIRAAKQAYLAAALAHLTSAGSRVSASHLSVLTGLTRKEITALLKEMQGVLPSGQGEAKEQRAKRVLRGWRLDPRFCNKDGTPATLSLRGDEKSFSMLVKLYGGDVTPNSVLRELERLKAVSVGRSRSLRLRLTRPRGRSTEQMSELARLFPDFAATVCPESPPDGRPLFFGFKDSVVGSLDQAALFQRTFSNRALAMLQGVHQWLDSQDRDRPTSTLPSDRRVHVGIGVYLVQRPDGAPRDRAKGKADTIGVRKTRALILLHPFPFPPTSSRSALRKIFPTLVLGSSSRK
jgi:hypothetical protein